MRSPKPLSRVVAGDPLLAAWDARRRREAALTHAARGVLPRQLAARIRVASSHEMLEIVADSGAVATAVRQRLVAVQERLTKDGHLFAGIRVRVEVRTEPALPEKRAPNQRRDVPTAALSRFAESIAPGPLRASIERLLKRSH